MKPKRHTWALDVSIAAVVALTLASTSHATDLFWDGTDTTADADGGDGTWLDDSGTTTNWDGAATAGADTAWTNANNDTALFGGTAGTVTLGSAITTAGMEFSVGGYTVDGGGNTITIGNNGGIRSTNTPGPSLWTPAGTTTINADIDNNGFLFTTVGSGSATLSGIISGSGGFSTYNDSKITLTGANTYTGKTFIQSDTTGGSTLTVSSLNSVVGGTTSSNLGAPTTVADGTIQIGNSGKRCSCTLIYTGPGETTDRVVDIRYNSSAVQTIQASGAGLLKFTSAFVSNATNQSGGFRLTGTGSGELVQGLPAVSTASTYGVKKEGVGTWTLGGTSTVNSTVTVSAGTLTINGQLNTASTLTVSSSGTLNGSGSLGFDIDGTTADQVVVTGSGTLDISGLAVEIIPGGVSGLTEAEYVLVDATGVGYSGTFTGFTGTPPTGYQLDYNTADQVKLVQIGGGEPYDDWATGGELFEDDANGDGVKNGLAFLLGAAGPDDDATGLLPTVRETAGGLVLTFSCLPTADRGTAELRVDYSNDLSTWTATTDEVPDSDGTDAGGVVSFVVTGPGGTPSVNSVTATINASAASGGKLFGRLKAEKP